MKEKVLDQIDKFGYIQIPINDCFVYKKRNAAYELSNEGVIYVTFSTPSYLTYSRVCE